MIDNSLATGKIFRYFFQSFAVIHLFSFQRILTNSFFDITSECNIVLHFRRQKARGNVKTFFVSAIQDLKIFISHGTMTSQRWVGSNGGPGTFYTPESIPPKSTCEAIAKESHPHSV